MRIAKIAALLFLAGITAFGIASYVDTAETVFSFQDDYLGASGFPKIFGGVLIALCLIDMVRTFMSPGAEADEETRLTKSMYMAIAVSCLYILGFSYLGFMVSTVPYLILMSLVFVHFDFTHIKGIILYSVAVTLVTKGFFTAFKVYLPDTLLI